MTEEEVVAWHHRLNGHESEQTPGDSEGQGSLACCSPWGREESDTTERLNNQLAYTVLERSKVSKGKGFPIWVECVHMCVCALSDHPTAQPAFTQFNPRHLEAKFASFPVCFPSAGS